MQHETSWPSRLGFDEFDVSNSYCEYVVERATEWLREAPADRRFLLTAGFFETHRPYPHDRYEPADPAGDLVQAVCRPPRHVAGRQPRGTGAEGRRRAGVPLRAGSVNGSPRTSVPPAGPSAPSCVAIGADAQISGEH